MSIFPTTADSILSPEKAPYLEYPVYIAQAGQVNVDLIIGPTLNFVPGRGLRVAVSFDAQPPKIVDAIPRLPESDATWSNAVRDNSRKLTSSHSIDRPGKHTLRITMVDPAVVLQQLFVYREPLPRTYFGPPTDR